MVNTIKPKNSPFHNLEWIISEPYGNYDSGGVHRGIDLVQYPYNDKDFTIPVYSISNNALVFQTGYNASMGNFVRFKEVNSNNAFTYMHLMDNSINVKVGDKITFSSRLGIMGTTGNSTGLHLHIEMRTMNGSTPSDYVNSPLSNPADFLGVVNKSYRNYWVVYYWEYNSPNPPIKWNKNSHFKWSLYRHKRKNMIE